ncbi:MAG: signal peptidase I, partial [FCB group bacterium]|nr:signal peptidase I [FCB group bacterium]
MEYQTEGMPPGFGNEVKEEPIYRQQVVAPKSDIKIKTQKPIWRAYLETIAIALLAALILRVFVVSAYHVSSGSMEDTLLEGDYIFVNKLAYEFSPPKLGDIIVFENPYNPTMDYIKRLVAAEGQTVEIYDKILYVDGYVAPIPEDLKHSDEV